MPTQYMLFWSIVMTLAIGTWRLRQWSDVLFIIFVTAVVLFVSRTLFIHLTIAANLDPSLVLQSPLTFLQGGVYGWLALIVMPCGWLGPIIGVNLLQRKYESIG
jgi:hypothetical protein